MKKLLFLTALLLATPIGAALADAVVTQENWVQVAPAGESFSILMPTSAYEVARAIPLSEQDWVPGRVWYSVADARRYMVISFAKTSYDRTPGLSDFDHFVSSFEWAAKSRSDKFPGNQVTSFRGLESDSARTVKLYQIMLGKYQGVARLIDADKTFYVLMVIGAGGSDPDVDRFLRSFAAGKTNSEPLNVNAAVKDYRGTEAEVNVRVEPPEPWPSQASPISGGILNGKATVLPLAPYPQSSTESGLVKVGVLVSEDGNVIFAEVIDGPKSLRAAAIAAVLKTKFSPTRLSGQPVKISGVLVYRFVHQ
jgi:Gram-negative bacterial TonB protein C-terminal